MNVFKITSLIILTISSLEVLTERMVVLKELRPLNNCYKAELEKLPVLVCKTIKSTLEKEVAEKSVDEINSTDNKVLQKIAEIYGNGTASMLLGSILSETKIKSEKYVTFVNMDSQGCSLKHTGSSFISQCNGEMYDLNGVALQNSNAFAHMDLIGLRTKRTESGFILTLRNEVFDFFPLKTYLQVTKKEKLKLALTWGKLEEVSKNITVDNINEALDESGNTPLFYALSGNQDNLLPVVKYLISIGANVNVMNDLKTTPLFFAVNSENDELIQMLIEEGASPCSIFEPSTLDYLQEIIKKSEAIAQKTKELFNCKVNSKLLKF
jgi:hypothetical protein